MLGNKPKVTCTLTNHEKEAYNGGGGGGRNYGSTEPRKAEYYVLRSFSKRRGQKDKETINN